MRFAGKVAIVTGGLSGIGAAVAARLASEGARVVAADITARETTLPDGDGAILPIALDVSDPGSVDALVAAAQSRFGRVDMLVNAAGIARIAPFLETTVDAFDAVIAVNLRGSFLIGQAVARAMAGQGGGGAIVLIGSVSGLRGNVDRAGYGASKGGVVTLAQVMANELAAHGIRVNVVAPGPIETPMVAAAHDPATRAEWERLTPMARYGTPAEVAAACAYLCSDDASYVTGTVMAVDGGMLGAGLSRRAI